MEEMFREIQNQRNIEVAKNKLVSRMKNKKELMLEC